MRQNLEIFSKLWDISDLPTAQVASHLQKYRNYLKRPSCGKKSKKSPRIETPAECINKTSLESEDVHSMLQQDQSSQLDSTLHSDNIFETQQQSNDVTNYQVPDSGYNYETQQHSTDVSDGRVSDIMSNDFPDPSDSLFDLDELISLLF
ncbi:unnamed protein product [Lathyrus sativus]|nr:unnamed protein product [Lathyrus sativus]